jgi:hypothetical protein
VGQEDDDEGRPKAGDEAGQSGTGDSEEAKEDEAFRSALRHYSRRARLFKR